MGRDNLSGVIMYVIAKNRYNAARKAGNSNQRGPDA